MTISSLNSGKITDYLLQNQASSLFGTQQSSTNTDPMAAILQGQEQMVTISALGKTANQAYITAMKSGDSNVIAGFQSMMSSLYSSPLTAESVGNLHTFSKMAQENTSAFNATFANVNTMNNQGLNTAVSSYLNSVASAYGQSGTEGVDKLNTSVTSTLQANATDATAAQKALTELFNQYAASTTAPVAGNTEILSMGLKTF